MKSAAPIKNKYNVVGGDIYTFFLNSLARSIMPKRDVIIYSRPGCHLCDEAKMVIQNSGCNDRFTLEEVNIESDEVLLKKYKYDIPVVMIDGVEAFRHRVKVDEFIRLICVQK